MHAIYQNTDQKPLFMSAGELAELLHEVRGTIYNKISKNQIPSPEYPFQPHYRSRKVLFLVSEVEEYFASLPRYTPPLVTRITEPTPCRPRRGRPRKTAPTAQGGV